MIHVKDSLQQIPIGSMYGICTYIWPFFMVNVGKFIKFTIHGNYGIGKVSSLDFLGVRLDGKNVGDGASS